MSNDDFRKTLDTINKFREVSALKDIKAENEKKNKILGEQNLILKQSELRRQKDATDLKRIEEAKLRKEEERLSIEQEKQQIIQDVKKRRDIFFNLKENLHHLTKVNKKCSNLEKYLLLRNISQETKYYQINTDFTENFDEKKLIKDYLISLKDEIENLNNKLNNSEKEDIKKIVRLFNRDKTSEIEELKSSKDVENYNNFLKIKENLKKATIASLIIDFKEDIKDLKKI